MIHHVQIACPRGSEPAVRQFYAGILGLAEVPKPEPLAARGGCWFVARRDAAARGGAAGDSGPGIELHLGVDDDFRPARKAHPGLLWPADDMDALAGRLTAAGYPVTWCDELPGMRRFHSEDPHGNRLEFLTPAV